MTFWAMPQDKTASAIGIALAAVAQLLTAD